MIKVKMWLRYKYETKESLEQTEKTDWKRKGNDEGLSITIGAMMVLNHLKCRECYRNIWGPLLKKKRNKSGQSFIMLL